MDIAWDAEKTVNEPRIDRLLLSRSCDSCFSILSNDFFEILDRFFYTYFITFAVKGVRVVNHTDWESWKRWSKDYNMLPYRVEIEWKSGLPQSWEAYWRQSDPCSFVLESGRLGRYTILGLSPVALLIGREDQAEERVRIEHPKNEPHMSDASDENIGRNLEQTYELSRTMQGRPLDIMRDWMSTYRSPDADKLSFFTGGCVGYVGYDVARSLEKLPQLATDDLELPEYAFMMFDRVWVYDHEKQTLTVCIHTYISREMANGEVEETKLREWYQEAEVAAQQMIDVWRSCADEGCDKGRKRQDAFDMMSHADKLDIDLEQDERLGLSMSKEEFTSAVERIQEYIRAGDVFQVNLSVRQERTVGLPPEVLYEWMRLLNPSPYMGLLRFGEFQLASVSPELLVKQEAGYLRTRPIAGTRRRGLTLEEDQKLETELRTSEKERAEHVMLVDLERNDFGKVSQYGSVKVDQLMVVERYSHVMHLVSEVSGKLREGMDTFDALAAVFPGGTITGAPKIRTMEIIEELEPVRRGVYTGSFGWIDYNGNMEFNIIIRTLLAIGERAYVQAGAGIVIDSIPEREYKESLSKAKALWKAVQIAEIVEDQIQTQVDMPN